MEKSSFYFIGTLPSSKSLMNRSLIVKSYFPQLVIHGQSECDDVILMERGIGRLLSGQTVDCGHAGTVLRFLALRAARLKGRHELTGSPRLFERPQAELLPILRQLGANAEFTKNKLIVESNGWNLIVDGLYISNQRSSQFATAVALNAWLLPFDLHFQLDAQLPSVGYWQMTIALLRRLGMDIQVSGREYSIAKNQSLRAEAVYLEPDMSSAFAVGALATLAGEAVLRAFPEVSLQPDAKFVGLLEKMGAVIKRNGSDLTFRRAEKLNGIEIDISDSPDLFPVLTVLMAAAQTPSKVHGIEVLEYKESPRLSKASELLTALGARLEIMNNSATIYPAENLKKDEFVFDVADDHRLVMAVAAARAAGYPVTASSCNGVTKSFPEFLQIAGGFL